MTKIKKNEILIDGTILWNNYDGYHLENDYINDGYNNLNVEDSVYRIVVSNPKINIAPHIHFSKFLSKDSKKNSNYKFSGPTKIIPGSPKEEISNPLILNQEKEIVQKMKDLSQKMLKQLEEIELQSIIVNNRKSETRLEKFNNKLQQVYQKMITTVRIFFSKKIKV